MPSPNTKRLLNAIQAKPAKGDLRRAQILKGAIQIISKKGVSALTFEQVGKVSKMARSHVVYYYPSRDKLITEAIRFATLNAKDIILDHVGSTTVGKEALVRYVEGNFKWVQKEHQDLSLYTLLYHQSTYQKHYSDLHEEIRQVGIDVVRGILETMSEIPKSKIPELTVNILGIITGNIIDAVSLSRQKLLPLRLKQTLAAVEALIQAA